MLGSSDMMALLMASLIGGLPHKRSRSQSPLDQATPKCHRAKSTIAESPRGLIVMSPVPADGFQLQACLHKFAEVHGC